MVVNIIMTACFLYGPGACNSNLPRVSVRDVE
jgi:hypothetical protein